ncbi:hypothetical protein EHS39_04050 [Ensifer sp. MPMI2T]|nr:hypothetical protein EHS39_04050 [Ensifer sp. MPMI2T]
MPAADSLPFFRAWLAAPLRVAAVAPSGAALAKLITSEISEKTGHILELGPGTGAFTRALLARGVAERDLTLVEFDANFSRMLGYRFPEARILHMDASRLHRADLFPGQLVGASVSGLPLLSMPKRKVMRILDGVFRSLRPGAALYQFTYGPRCPVPRPVLDRLGLKAVRIGGTYANLPPAAVYRISQRKTRRLPPSAATGI